MPEPRTVETDRKTPALALSGGGFRATLFHCGALLRLNELGYLSRITRISSVSGGSIASGMLAAAWPRLRFENGVAVNLTQEVVEPLRAFCRRSIDTMAVGWGSVLPGQSIGDVLANAYDDMFNGISLQDLPDSPQFIFNATNLQTGRLVRMEKRQLADYTIGKIARPHIRLAVAVAASSAFPPILSPVEIDLDPVAWEALDGTVHTGDLQFTQRLALTDGGVYDNLGLETVDDFDPVIVSDAGAPFGTEETASALWPKQALRALDIATDQARGLRKRLLFAQTRATGRKTVFAGIEGDLREYSAPQVLGAAPGIIAWMAALRTRLDPFSEREQGRLINWGWLMMDVALRSYLAPDVPPPDTFPIPTESLADP
ncbi:NTE family protein [Rhizobium aethiopicum]|uniref:NTE family protein n=1 Tax=Rhizobium aethiopicum TaxID=1138170 RepID=A0A1C3Y0U0_9HYPH|nr:patatin-like phospholipase family protein [Rhizobium aethiopicum]SCB58080.1 NTE family protein [Rhizobium aethiopicum]